ncbi:MAG: 50S ribosomal protein L19e [Candidatus Pacearchaeota archaeon]|jgi:large subunit ribosomal protein L19e
MNLASKKELAAKTLGVGKARITFIESRLSEIKEALTKQDIRDLATDGAIVIREVKGRKKVEKRKRRRGVGKVRRKVNTRKQDYVIMTRKLRGYVAELKKRGELAPEEVTEIRKRIRNKKFRSKAHLKEYIGGLRK